MTVAHAHAHGHDRSAEGLRAVGLSLLVLGLTTVLQMALFSLTGSVALLADLVHNAGDAFTALPIGAAFLLRSAVAEHWAGVAVVLAIVISAGFALVSTIDRLLHPRELDHLWVLAFAGVIGFLGNELAARVRLRAGERLGSAALIADGQHARVDGFVSLGVVASAATVGAGLELADPLIGLAIVALIARIAWQAWKTIR
jgi:cation diffusion facilitator family transporter